MDPDLIRQLEDEFYKLNESVRQTDNTFLDVLGPAATTIRDKLKSQNNQLATNQSQTTDKIENSYNKRKALADKQKDLYRQQMKRRGYDIDQSGKEVKTSIELTQAQQQQLDVLDKNIKRQQDLTQASDKPVQAFRQLAGSTNDLSGLMGKFQDKMFEMTGKSVGGAMVLTTATAALTGAAKAYNAMTDAIWKGERGASVSAKGAAEFSKSVTTAAYGIGAALMMLPLGPILKIVGAAIAVLAAATEGATKLLEMGADLNDKLYKSYNTLSEKGLTTAKGMNGLYNTLHKVGLSAAEVEKFNKLLGENSKNLAMFGGTAAKGVEKFEKVAGAIAAPTSKLNKEFLLMGINSDAQREHIMNYMTEEDRLGLANQLSDEQRIAGAKKYIENLDKLSMLTGANRKELEEARAGVMANENLRAAIFDAEQDKTEAGQARLAELKRFYEAASMLQAAGDTKGATGIAEYAAGRGITGQASATAFIQFGGKGGLIDRAKKGGTSAELAEAASKGYTRQMDMMADTKRFGGDTSGLMTGTFAQGQEFTSRMAEVQKKAAEANMSVSDYLEKEQEARKNSKDKTTQQNAEVAQQQQKTAMILDDAAKKVWSSADVLMGPAMKTFSEANKLFGEAVKRVAKEKGISVEDAKDPEAELRAEIAKIKESMRIKQKSIDNIDPKYEQNRVYIAKMKAEMEVLNKDLANAESKMATVLDEKKRMAAADAAQLPPGATIPTPGTPEQQAGAGGTRSLAGTTEGPPKLSQVSSKSGKSASVNSALAPAFQGLLDYLDNAGYKIYSLGGYVDRDVRGKPGVKSIHAHGAAIDINPSTNPLGSELVTDMPGNISEVAAGLGLGWGGNWKSRKDAMHFSGAVSEGGKLLKASTGAMFSGPKDGYFVQLHGKEFVGNEQQLEAIKNLIDVVKAQTEGGASGTDTAMMDDDTAEIIEQFTAMLDSKTDELIDKIKFGNRVDEDLLNYSQG